MSVTTSSFVEMAKAGDLENGQMKGYQVGDKKILLAKVDDKWYAASDVCPHMKAKLSTGTLNGTVLTCPKHGSQFDLKDGHVVRWTDFSGIKLKLINVVRSPRPLAVYPVQIDGDRVMVQAHQ